ncbi:MAG: YdcH family protein [Glaciecola sp.]
MSDKIQTLNTNSGTFKDRARRYHDLDNEIRHLELQNSPTDDATMHDIKQQRAALKDLLYQQLIAED